MIAFFILPSGTYTMPENGSPFPMYVCPDESSALQQVQFPEVLTDI